jgi:hypothetical protein
VHLIKLTDKAFNLKSEHPANPIVEDKKGALAPFLFPVAKSPQLLQETAVLRCRTFIEAQP